MIKARTHDIILTDTDGNKYGFMLDRKNYQEQDIEKLPPSYITGEASYFNISPDKEVFIQQTDWRKGLQDLFYDDERRYYQATNTDARFKGRVILSPKDAEIDPAAITDLYPVQNGDFESWTDETTLDNWTKGGARAITTRTTDKHGGTYACKLTLSTNGTDYIYRDIQFTPGKQYTFRVWCKQEGNPEENTKIGIDDGVGTTYSDTITAIEYTQISVTRTLDAAATRLRLIIQLQTLGAGPALYADDATITYDDTFTPGECSRIINFADRIYFAFGSVLYVRDSTGDYIANIFPKDITDMCVYQNRLFVAQGWSDEYFYTDDVIFTECTLANSTAKYMSNIGNAQFWISDTVNTLRDSDNPINGGTEFSTPYTVGSSAYEITGLVDDDEIVFVRKQDQVYYLSEGDVLSAIPELKSEVNTDVNYPLYEWKGSLYIPSGINSFYEYNRSSEAVNVLSPVRFAVGDTTYDGRITGMAGDEEYLYVSIDADPTVIVLAGHYETTNTTDWVWHPIYQTNIEGTPVLYISNADGAKKLYIGCFSKGIWVSPTGHNDPNNKWYDEIYAYDDNLNTYAYDSLNLPGEGYYLELTHSAIPCSEIRIWAEVKGYPFLLPDIDIDVYYSDDWHNIFSGTISKNTWVIKTFTENSITKARVRSNITSRLLRLKEFAFFQKGSGGDPVPIIKTILLPVSYADVLQESGYQVCSSGEFITPWYRTNFGAEAKYFPELQVTSICVTDTTSIDVYYQLKGDTDWTSLGSCTKQDLVGTDYPPEYTDTFTIGESSERIRFKFALATEDEDYSPVLYGLGGGLGLVGKVLFTEKKREFNFVLRVAAGLHTTANAPTLQTVSGTLADLNALCQENTVTLTTPNDDNYTVTFTPGGLKISLDKEEQGRPPEWLVAVNCSQV